MNVNLATIDDFGGWDKAQETHFADGGVFDQAVRSDMNWSELASGEKAELVKHWQKLGEFRKEHPAIAAGSHKKISDAPYVFVREKVKDKVMVVFAGRKG